MMRLTFLGAAGTVTGSRHMVEVNGKRLLVDCGLFQGPKKNRLKNWEPFPVEPSSIDAIMLTHAHIDHIGFLPAVVKAGFRGPIYCTKATADLAGILLPDSGHLQEEEAKWANKKGYSKHSPAKPLYTEQDAKDVLQYLEPVDYGQHFEPAPNIRAKYRDAGHILGAAFLDLKSVNGNGTKKIVFSGDLGRPTDAILRAPVPAYNVDYLVAESTYGNRLHEETFPEEELVRVVNESMERGGVLVIPAFAVGRSQTLLYALRELEMAGRIPEVPVYLDSPMANNALHIHRRHVPDLNLVCRKKSLAGVKLFHPNQLRLSVTRQDSININSVKKGAIIISASGMVTGGRILHHLKERLPYANNTVLFIGYQAEGTRGRTILEGKESVRMFGEDVPVKAHIERIEGYSGHADYREILAWMMGFNKAPERVFLVHGEPEASQAMAEHIRQQFKWDVTVA
ncbi:MAG TPA: MBL fold metallo-hydrolase, partial [Oceanipulchritudo sp.]|nr:MBL fold metallo-hydrolase [Oceanipulchritudo sp.]